MHVNVRGALVKVATRRPKFDKDGKELEGAGLVITIDLPICDLASGDLAGILRAVDRKLTVDLDDGQTAFDLAERDGVPTLMPVR